MYMYARTCTCVQINVGVLSTAHTGIWQLFWLFFTTTTIRLLKTILQYCENVTSLTSVEKNRWDETEKLTTQLYDKLLAGQRK